MTGNAFGGLLPMPAKTTVIAAIAAATLTLGACGGGGGSAAGPEPPPPVTPEPQPDGVSEEELAALRSDPEVVRIGGILERADTLLFSSLHSRYSLSGGGETLSEAPVERMNCAGARCTGSEGAAVAVADLTDPSGPAVRLSEAARGSRGGLDTVATRGAFEVRERVPGVTLTATPSIRSWGFWGEHGFAALEIGSGRLTGTVEGTAFAGEFSLAQAYAAGDATGTNPAGAGGATWRGIAEASPTGRFERLTGTATVRIADLSRPRVSVAIDVPGHDIGAPGWADMPLANGGFSSGIAGTDWLGGNFHGPAHEEAWGVFDTARHIGAFGARRQP